MVSDRLLEEIRGLSRAEKLNVLQMLTSELTTGDNPFFRTDALDTGKPTPDVPEVLQMLQALIEDHKERNQPNRP